MGQKKRRRINDSVSFPQIWNMNILVFLIVLSVLVLIHEFGHFFVAKFFKIKVEEFGFGLPPRAVGKKIGETIYSLNWLPIGGFVKLYGEDEAGAGRLKIQSPRLKVWDKKRAFYARSWWQRALVIVAGVVMNFLLAYVIISSLFAFVGVNVPGNKVLVQSVVKGSPADISGLKVGDQIEYINSTKITNVEQLVNETRKHLGEALTLKVGSEGREETIEITPRKNYPKNEGPMGVAISQNSELKKYSLLEAPVEGFKQTVGFIVMYLQAAGTLISQIFSTGQVPEYSFAGPVGIAQLTGRYVQLGIPDLLFFVAVLSLNLAIINIIPIPGLDGGRLFFILLAAILGKPINPKYENYAHTVGIALLYVLLLAITFHDVSRLLSGQPILPK